MKECERKKYPIRREATGIITMGKCPSDWVFMMGYDGAWEW